MTTAVLSVATVAVAEVVAHLVNLLLRFLVDVSDVDAAAVLAEAAATSEVVAALLIELDKLAGLATAAGAARAILLRVVVLALVLESGTGVVLSVLEAALVTVLALLLFGPVVASLALFLLAVTLFPGAGLTVSLIAVLGGLAAISIGCARSAASATAAAGAGVIRGILVVAEAAVLASALAIVTEVVADSGRGVVLSLAIVFTFDVLALAVVAKHTLSTLVVAANLLGDVAAVTGVIVTMSESASVAEVALLVLLEVVAWAARAARGLDGVSLAVFELAILSVSASAGVAE